MKQIVYTLLIAGLSACATGKNGNENTGRQQRLRVAVGEIKEIRLASQGDSTIQLIGSSDNTEVVEVSRRQLAPPVDTLTRDNSGPAIFEIKGVTTGTAKVVFSEKRAGEQGSGQPRKTYVVQVVTK
ncbi:hypothetical protein DYU11_12835 [Fibrisoma montanum]|uniref:Uncharacterized protein n=1 Tax=Fibrisoma montanum TaxID=2305895 RepID=A0A418MBV2_9BACT|nr:protease inhibitor I42 family protein [Fibrisoma montanum]RIV23844.1 hypothetical protein DYU11_12835 [Fibrisoma montanum]